MQLTRCFWVGIALLLLPARSYADGTVGMRGAYYKERSTRVVQPMFDVSLDAGDSGLVTGHIVVDAITSASAASGAVGQSFTEQRYEAGLGYQHSIGVARVGGSMRLSSEPDYRSRFFALRGEIDLAQRNTTLGITLAKGDDDLDNSGSQGGLSERTTGQLSTHLLSLSASQLLSERTVFGLSYDVTFLDGFLENPYRTVVAGGIVEPERVPDSRVRHAVAGNLRYFAEPIATAWIATHRYYFDDWKVRGNTSELRAVHEPIESFEIHGRYRYHRQRRAYFYRDVYDSNLVEVEPYLTADAKLSRVRSHTMGLKASSELSLLGVHGRWHKARIEASFDYLVQNTYFGNAVIGNVGLILPWEY